MECSTNLLYAIVIVVVVYNFDTTYYVLYIVQYKIKYNNYCSRTYYKIICSAWIIKKFSAGIFFNNVLRSMHYTHTNTNHNERKTVCVDLNFTEMS